MDLSLIVKRLEYEQMLEYASACARTMQRVGVVVGK